MSDDGLSLIRGETSPPRRNPLCGAISLFGKLGPFSANAVILAPAGRFRAQNR